MKPAPIPADDKERLRSLHSLAILDTPAEGRFDRITRLARRLFDVPIVAVSLVDECRQWFKSVQGLDVRETPRDISFCGHAIHLDGVMEVGDAAQDERFVDNPLVTGEPGIRFYAGQPLVGPDGAKLGTLCLIDRQPRQLSDKDRLALQDLASLVETELNVNRMSATQHELLERLEQAQRHSLQDALTEMWNRAGIIKVLETEMARAVREQTEISVVMADIDHFKTINDTHGHDAGDAVLREVAQRMRVAVRVSDTGGRLGGEEFVFVLPSCGTQPALAVAERIRVSLAGEEMSVSGGKHLIPVTLSLGVATIRPDAATRVETLLKRADKALYRAKDGGRNRVENARDTVTEPPFPPPAA